MSSVPITPAMRAAFTLSAVAIGLAVFACSKKDATAPPFQPPAECALAGQPAAGATQAYVAMRGFAFSPDTIHVAAGTTVIWINCERPDIDPHTATATAGEWDSGYLQPGAKYSRTFGAAGRFGYTCIPHPFMKGAVVVQ
jgi:plastocyanin